MSVMSHTIIELLDMCVMPASPLLWHRKDGGGTLHVWDMNCPIETTINASIFEDFLANRMWAGVSSHEANGGLEEGEPDITVAKEVIAQLNPAGKLEEASQEMYTHPTTPGILQALCVYSMMSTS